MFRLKEFLGTMPKKFYVSLRRTPIEGVLQEVIVKDGFNRYCVSAFGNLS